MRNIKDHYRLKLSDSLERTPSLSSLTLENISPWNKDLLYFLEHIAPIKLKWLLVSDSHYDNKNIDQDRTKYNLDKHKNICRNTSDGVSFYDWNFNDHSFQSIIKCCSNSKSIAFWLCKLKFSNYLDFSGPDYKIKKIEIIQYYKEMWLSDDSFKKIIAGISNCSLKDSLKEIRIKNGWSSTFMEQIRKDYQLEHIEIICY